MGDKMKLKTILFDLDGTLLPMDQDVFIQAYIKGLCVKTAPLGYDPKKLSEALWAGTGAMVKNDGSMRNEDVFWKVFAGVFGEDALADRPVFDELYRNEFQKVKDACGFDARAAKLIDGLKKKGYRLVLATNPLFPAVATYSRVRWAGLSPEDFDWITTYENASFCKPNTKYYEEIIAKLALDPAECLMVGNDADENMIADKLSMKTFLLTDCLLNRSGQDISVYPNGGFDSLEAYIDALEKEE